MLMAFIEGNSPFWGMEVFLGAFVRSSQAVKGLCRKGQQV